jgi:imidazolonepropionase-like amidohydrolase
VSSLIEADDAKLLEGMRAAALSAVQAGITTVRDLGDRNYTSLILAEEIARNPERGPEILPAGPPITTPDGHCFFMGGETEGLEALRAAVRERHARGCAVVKIMASGGNMTKGSAPHKSQYSLEHIRAVVDEAHSLGMSVAAHAHGAAAIRDALTAGVDTLEHVTFMAEEGCDAPPDLLAAIARSGTFVSMTLGADPSAPTIHEALKQLAAAVYATYSELHRLGAKMVVGTDAGIAPQKPHDVLPHAVATLPSLGVPPLDALVSVTSLAAEACGVDGRKGRVETGADADFLVVGGDPVQDLDRLRDVRAVFRAGVRVR